ncbi:MAG: hypothetical protein K2Y33_12370 [Mycolicibacterium frederiksbergense]|nr:hypothetical protein [Mycolicibacterium frederiksbergense]
MAAAGWDARDINTLIQDWAIGHWLPSNPYRPIGLLRRMIANHGDLAHRPADADRAREAEDERRRHQRLADAREEAVRHAAARQAALAALGGPGHTAAREALARARRKALVKRTQSAAVEHLQIQDAVQRARGEDPPDNSRVDVTGAGQGPPHAPA